MAAVPVLTDRHRQVKTLRHIQHVVLRIGQHLIRETPPVVRNPNKILLAVLLHPFHAGQLGPVRIHVRPVILVRIKAVDGCHALESDLLASVGNSV